jgi:two-component system chemotaxis response regulator CheB
MLEKDGDIQVVGEAADGAAAVQAASTLKPDLATMDIGMPGMDGFEAIGRIMSRSPVPILVVTGQPTARSGELVFEAVRRGALDLAQKPLLWTDKLAGAQLRAQVRRLARVPVVHHAARKPVAAMGVGGAPPQLGRALSHLVPGRIRLVAIGASAGGPGAVAAILSQLGKEVQAAVAVVQHIPSGFAQSFARFLANSCALQVAVLGRREPCQPGHVWIAPDDRHLVVTSEGSLVAVDTPPLGGHRPSVDVLFASAAQAFGPAAAGVILSGIGSDGAQGMVELRRAGALTLAQDEATSAVFGMPRAAVRAGGVEQVLPLPELALLLATLTAPRRREGRGRGGE